MSDHHGKCRLCEAIGPLCRSHIVPELAYAPIKNDKGQVYSVGQTVKKIQTGYFERLLCQRCEQLFSGWESQFKKVWMDTIPPSFGHLNTRPHKDMLEVAIDNYTLFKLFHLSILWRAALSSNFKLDRNISLGRYDRQIARMLLAGDPGQPGDFPFFASLNLDDQKAPVPVVAPLAQGIGRFEGHRYYLMTYAYCDWIFIIANPGTPWMARIESHFRSTNTFLLASTPNAQSKGFNLWADIFSKLRTKW